MLTTAQWEKFVARITTKGSVPWVGYKQRDMWRNQFTAQPALWNRNPVRAYISLSWKVNLALDYFNFVQSCCLIALYWFHRIPLENVKYDLKLVLVEAGLNNNLNITI